MRWRWQKCLDEGPHFSVFTGSLYYGFEVRVGRRAFSLTYAKLMWRERGW